MLVIVGALIVIVSVFGGFMLEGGHMGVLFQPIELLIIGGAAAGSLVLSSPMSLIKQIMGQVSGTIKSHDPTKQEYVECLLLLFELCKLGKQNLLGLEPHIETPESSDIFSRYPNVLKNHHFIDFVCDTLKVQIASPLSPFDLEELMDKDIAAAHNALLMGPTVVNRVGDAMPGLGIVAAVLGVVITMGKLSQGKEVIGHSVAAALVGTFLGILFSYGFFQPLAAKMSLDIENHGKPIEIAKIVLLAFAKDSSPKVCVEFGRRSCPPEIRPTFKEMEEATSAAGKKAA